MASRELQQRCRALFPGWNSLVPRCITLLDGRSSSSGVRMIVFETLGSRAEGAVREA